MSEPDESVFREYAGFYDALYATKDYDAEVDFIQEIIRARGVGDGASLLDMGCGTGGHVIPLARAGYEVTGIDRSAEMLAIARKKATKAGVTAQLLSADVRTVRLGRTFDAVISMFAVMGYQLSNSDLADSFATARRHLVSGGVFVFDAWFGPAVLSQRPQVAEKRVPAEDGGTLVRLARPTLDVVAQTVRVDYTLRRDGEDALDVSESHTMRFLFAQEAAYFLEVAGFAGIEVMPFMRQGDVPSDGDWSVTWVARAV